MPVHVELRRGIWRVVDGEGAVVTDADGEPRDGGGLSGRRKAESLARQINRATKHPGRE